MIYLSFSQGTFMHKHPSNTRPPLQELKKIALITRDDGQDYPTEPLRKLLKRAHIKMLEGAGHEAIDLVIALGGDGTVLRALTAYPLVPTLAVNYGRVGFLTQCNREDIEKVLVQLLSDEYFIEERLALNVHYKGTVNRCINEVVIKSIAHMNQLHLKVDGHFVHSMRGDGLIIGTPTGSTAYLMSTGAPLVTPGVSCVIANPLNEYRFSSRSIVLPGDAEIEVQVDESREQDLVLITDGGERIPLECGDTIKLTPAEEPTLLVAFEPQYFFRNLRERLDW
jgi:NAD+ kinase